MSEQTETTSTPAKEEEWREYLKLTNDVLAGMLRDISALATDINCVLQHEATADQTDSTGEVSAPPKRTPLLDALEDHHNMAVRVKEQLDELIDRVQV